MAIRITNIISSQGFEVVRDLIGAVLKVELDNQKIVQTLTEPINIFAGRTTPFNQSEILMINVLVDSLSVTSSFEAGSQDTVSFFIDVYCSATEKGGVDGGFESTKRRDKFVGIVKAILQDHHYKTLGLPLGLIMNTHIEGFENFESKNQQDAAFVKMSRITFSVRLIQEQSLWSGININSIFTDVKLDLSNKGYKYETQLI